VYLLIRKGREYKFSISITHIDTAHDTHLRDHKSRHIAGSRHKAQEFRRFHRESPRQSRQAHLYANNKHNTVSTTTTIDRARETTLELDTFTGEQ